MTKHPDPTEDQILVQDAVSGDEDARRELFRRIQFVGRLLQARNNRMGRPLDSAELEDLVQDILLVAWNKIASFPPEATIEAWAYRIAAFELLNALRRKGRRSRFVDIEAVQEPESRPSVRAELLEGRGLGRFLRHLAEREAEIVRLRHVEGLTFQELAGALEISASSAKTHYYRGLEKLRQIFSDGEEVR